MSETGYKGFNTAFQCTPNGKPFQFAVGNTYTERVADVCKSGFHYCVYPLDVLQYYPPGTSRYALIEALGDVSKPDGEENTKRSTNCVRIVSELALNELIQKAAEFTVATSKPIAGSHTKARGGAASATGESGAASATGERGAASATGERGAASATGERGAASATGERGAASATGERGAASATGRSGAASATGERGAASATGWSGAASATGERGAASATGWRGAASATGWSGAASATGERGAASATGWSGIACAHGIESKASAALGGWIVCSEWVNVSGAWTRSMVRAAQIDGETLKANTFYTLKGGEFVEVTDAT